jgi:hypothetical protein
MAFQRLTVRKWEEYLAAQNLSPLKKKKARARPESADA